LLDVKNVKRDEKVFINGLLTIMLILTLIGLLSIFFMINKNTIIIRFSFIILTTIIMIFILIILWSGFVVYKIINNGKISIVNYKILGKIIGLLYPLLITTAKLFKKDIDSIRRIYADINNFLVKSKAIRIKNRDLLILLPHCLQDSDCKIKITSDINNCKMCGKCNIKSIIELANKYDVKVIVATGGTLAREWIKRLKPRGIIAVACERDLSSGINDVKVIPVLGVVNERPNGPCFNTKVNLENLEDAIKFFIGED